MGILEFFVKRLKKDQKLPRSNSAESRMDSEDGGLDRIQTIQTWEAVTSVVTAKRIELLRYLRRHPTRSIRALAIALGRDYKNVHVDVKAMRRAGFLEVSAEGLHSNCDLIQIKIAV